MQRYFIQLAYDGANYHGWQIQPGSISVQEVLEKSISTISREEIHVTGAGRTDTGVHASFFVAHFDAESENLDDQHFTFRLNRFLPPDISVQNIYKVYDKAHARFDATYRTYQYFITKQKDPFSRAFAYHHYRLLDAEKMNEAAQLLFNYSDFTSFSRTGADAKTGICKMMEAYWTEEPDRYILTIKADRFLRNMVRAVVGTMLDIGMGKMEPKEIGRIIEAKDRRVAGSSAAARGLFLVDIGYPEEISQGLIRNPG
ncbi:tRNA pseudouridine(38-40) synthase TruA [Prolixibacter sp. NT017]|uniref:tRNA pseudouridine(38-40) synthase TruA n=1 Tax=Prolixibacter sp. NT017 TaxID=2652390 RepID=UPI00128537E8|nr:tRNA pseudouridine(38-40) synthase TruA [Prolixibacter sp. NT017]GET26155.1 tRNA pseudouridine synthase A [Prolixibacter sp. NT017]